jgi:carbamoyl-phosphate synthase large subunit
MSADDLPRRHAHRSILVTGACGVTSRTVVRALRRSPLFQRTRLVGIDVCDNPFALHEGLYERIHRVPPSRDGAPYLEAVNRICAHEHIDAAIVIPEPEVLFWAEHSMPVPALLPPPAFARLAISKARLYEQLQGSGLVPRHALLSRAQIAAGDLGSFDAWPLWLRDGSAGSTSGKGALCVHDAAEAAAWMTLNRKTEAFMASEFLPGRNLACLLLYHAGRLLKLGCYERLEYFMGHTALSGVTGNISKGRLVNDDAAVAVSRQAVERLCAQTGEPMNGLVTVDLRCDAQDRPKITEINLRPVAASSAFAEVPGANLIEALLLATLGEPEAAGPMEVPFPPHNRMFRDIDGLPVYVAEHHELAIGEAFDAATSNPRGAFI